MDNIGHAIKQLRKQRNIKQKTLAEKVGITNSYLSSIEAGNRIPSIEVLVSILKELNLPIAIIFIMAMSDEELEKYRKHLIELSLLIIKSYL